MTAAFYVVACSTAAETGAPGGMAGATMNGASGNGGSQGLLESSLGNEQVLGAPLIEDYSGNRLLASLRTTICKPRYGGVPIPLFGPNEAAGVIS